MMCRFIAFFTASSGRLVKAKASPASNACFLGNSGWEGHSRAGNQAGKHAKGHHVALKFYYIPQVCDIPS
jgi:hypothetical protein